MPALGSAIINLLREPLDLTVVLEPTQLIAPAARISKSGMGFLGKLREPRKAAKRVTIYWPAVKMHPEGCTGPDHSRQPHAELETVAVANDNGAAVIFDVVVTVEFLSERGDKPMTIYKIWRKIEPGAMETWSDFARQETFGCTDQERPPLAIRVEFRDEDKRKWMMRFGGKVHRLNGFSG